MVVSEVFLPAISLIQQVLYAADPWTLRLELEDDERAVWVRIHAGIVE